MLIAEHHCFYPDRFEYANPDQWDLSYADRPLPGPEGAFLSAWHIRPDRRVIPRGLTVLHLHGNAQNMTAHLFASAFLAREGFDLITFDYRGYGKSPGTPSLAGIIADGGAAVRALLDDPPVPGQPLALFGQSMGAFTSAHLLPDFPQLAAAILEAGLTSFRDLFLEVYPGADIKVPDGFSTLGPLAASRVPKLFLHGTADTVVPPAHSERMHQAAADPKELVILPGVGHIDALESPLAPIYRERVTAFLDAAARTAVTNQK